MSDIYVVLVRPIVSGNVGAVARVMANFGFQKLILIDPKCSIDEEARNRAKHAQKILDNVKIEKTLKKALSGFSVAAATTGVLGSDYNIPRTPLLAEAAAKKLSGKKGKIALVFGPEDSGLSNEELELCDFTITIPTSRAYPVMNLSHSVGVLLYEFSKNANSKIVADEFPLVSGKEKEALEKAMNSVIEGVSYRTPFEKRTQKLVWKRVLGKAAPTRREAFAMIGLLKKVAEKEKKK
ncbi:MAG: RNA methyltransferase [Candidatus Nanoarchaeia archaeon]